ncbi:hypothetical protein NE237_016186 [Protea cynaroides]|uniref:Uncharacterized protein n=1 Tax=Protea cynaroides TaxID=273540 RepID=A0A9Q0KFI6_9MAGN|nr:hypothetical protein NE237_016186 [Protea cynaroides]
MVPGSPKLSFSCTGHDSATNALFSRENKKLSPSLSSPLLHFQIKAMITSYQFIPLGSFCNSSADNPFFGGGFSVNWATDVSPDAHHKRIFPQVRAFSPNSSRLMMNPHTHALTEF